MLKLMAFENYKKFRMYVYNCQNLNVKKALILVANITGVLGHSVRRIDKNYI